MKSIRYIDRETGKLQKEVVPGEQWLQWLYHTPMGQLALHSFVKRSFLSRWYGKKMDTPKSAQRIPAFVKSLNINMSEAQKGLNQYTSFNDFFTRQLKSDARPIEDAPHTVISPADGKILAFNDLKKLDSFFIKGQSFNVETFLQNKLHAQKYLEGTLVIVRLAPVDYHRFHFPLDGRISQSTQIEGTLSSVSPYAVKNLLRIYWENKREYSILTTENAGDILLCEVGATMVGSIVQNYTPDTHVTKGQEKGWFKFGGSTVIMLFEKDTVSIDPDIISNTQKSWETAVKMGERIAITT